MNASGDGRRKEEDQRRFQPALVAIDLGAESCRVSLLRWTEGEPSITLVHRFANGPIQVGNSLRWNIKQICEGVVVGLRECAALAPEGVSAIGVDGWAVDYVRLGHDGQPVSNPYCYRDERNLTAMKQVHARISPERLYALSGVQILPLNTLYQLYADGASGKEQNTPWQNLPEFLLSYLGGRRVSEYTNATHTQMLDVHAHEWSREIFQTAGLDMNAAPPVVKPGTLIGRVQGPLASLPAFRNTQLIAPACHDTASAIAGIPVDGDDWAFISSGTWSLVGAVLDAACVSEAARRDNFSNEGGVGGKIYFLKNVNGMWLLRQCMEHWEKQGRAWTIAELVRECASLPAPEAVIDVDEPSLLLPGEMPARINKLLAAAGTRAIAEEPQLAPQVASLIFHSLAARYAAVLQGLMQITGKRLRKLCIVGGGGKNALLNQLTARSTRLEVFTGAAESATVGNFAVQLAALGGGSTAEQGVKCSAVAAWAGRLTASRAQSAPTVMEPAAIS